MRRMIPVTVTVDTDVDVDVDLGDFNDRDLKEELESRGYKVISEEDREHEILDKYECELILNELGWDNDPGSDLGFVAKKIMDVYYGR